MKEIIEKHLGKSEEIDYLIPYTKNHIENLKYATTKYDKKDVSEDTIKNKVKDVDLEFREKFIDFLDKKKNCLKEQLGNI